MKHRQTDEKGEAPRRVTGKQTPRLKRLMEPSVGDSFIRRSSPGEMESPEEKKRLERKKKKAEVFSILSASQINFSRG